MTCFTYHRFVETRTTNNFHTYGRTATKICRGHQHIDSICTLLFRLTCLCSMLCHCGVALHSLASSLAYYTMKQLLLFCNVMYSWYGHLRHNTIQIGAPPFKLLSSHDNTVYYHYNTAISGYNNIRGIYKYQ